MSWWRYCGRCSGRVLHFLYHYVGFDAAELAVVGNGEVIWHGAKLATFTWSTSFSEADVPVFSFFGERADDYEQNQRDRKAAAFAEALPEQPSMAARIHFGPAVPCAIIPDAVRGVRLWSQIVEHVEPTYFVADGLFWAKSNLSLHYWSRDLGAWLRGPVDAS